MLGSAIEEAEDWEDDVLVDRIDPAQAGRGRRFD
jgi:hypothetical protein